jgi:hypothetical protein
MTAQPVPLPPPAAVLLRSRAEAMAGLAAIGWRPWLPPAGFDAERRRLLNADLSEPDVMLPDGQGGVLAVARVETDPAGFGHDDGFGLLDVGGEHLE